MYVHFYLAIEFKISTIALHIKISLMT